MKRFRIINRLKICGFDSMITIPETRTTIILDYITKHIMFSGEVVYIRKPNIFDVLVWFHDGVLMKNHTELSDDELISEFKLKHRWETRPIIPK